MEQDKKLPPIVVTLILTSITSFFWIFFSVYRSLTMKPEPVVPSEILSPINPKLDLNTIELIKTKIYVDDVPEIYTPSLNVSSENKPVLIEEENIDEIDPAATEEAEIINSEEEEE